MRVLLLSLCIAAAANVYSQQAKTNTIQLPLRQGVVTGKSAHGVSITSSNDSCFASEDGIISSIADLGDNRTIIIKTSSGTFATYSNLYSASLTRGTVVEKGTFIGRVKKDMNDFKLAFILLNNKGELLTEQSHLDYLSKNASL
jgi:hypothetical protein